MLRTSPKFFTRRENELDYSASRSDETKPRTIGTRRIETAVYEDSVRRSCRIKVMVHYKIHLVNAV
jgi:short subunit dehydrogenase-like uncharacterized protein